MKINRIRLYNFSSYEGINELNFENGNANKNIILIGGKNGAGKTSLFIAIKIALYGPLAFGYVGVNSHYVSKIKDFINTKAYQQDKVEAEVQISISLKVEREIKEYIITRKWEYSKQKLSEEYYVEKDGVRLEEQELSYFQNYLQSIVPPDLFEFFLFDGEEVGNIFSTSTYNTYVRNAVFMLCNMDVFEIIRKYTNSYVSKTAENDKQNLHIEYETAKIEVERLEERNGHLVQSIKSLQCKLEELEIQLVELETAFKNAGGITEEERKQLLQEFAEAEKAKTESVAKIKMFVEGLMPFFIVRDFTSEISEQLDFEEKGEIYSYVQNKLRREEINTFLNEKGSVKAETVDALMDLILNKFKPKGYNDDSDMIFDLSKEETARVNGIISNVEDFDKQEMIDIVKERTYASKKTADINKILKSVMSDEEASRFAERENYLLKEKGEVLKKLHEKQTEIEKNMNELSIQRQIRDKAFQMIKESAQNQHVYELSSGISNMMQELLDSKTAFMRKKLEKLIVQNLQKIYRKNNLITHVEITEDFQFNLYQDEQYSDAELLYLIRNLGSAEFVSLIGVQGEKTLLQIYKANSIVDVRQALEYKVEGKQVNLYKKIELGRLSKGERQIFILSLYWAIIILSGQDIPFVIDTPYARIDANHRKEISQKFFPNISKQVIILSTDEEINEEYYRIIKPYVAREFMLINDENQNRTSVEEHYFFEVQL